MERRARTNPAQLHGLESKKKSTYRRGVFLDFPFYRTYQELAADGPANPVSCKVHRSAVVSTVVIQCRSVLQCPY
jgi:hypothetical protein